MQPKKNTGTATENLILVVTFFGSVVEKTQKWKERDGVKRGNSIEPNTVIMSVFFLYNLTSFVSLSLKSTTRN